MKPRAMVGEQDACGIGFVAHVDGAPRREIVTMAIDGLRGVEHRGAVAADATSGDGAGLLTQIPRPLFGDLAAEVAGRDVDADAVGVAFLFLQPGYREADEADRATARHAMEAALRREGAPLLGWRDVPVDVAAIGEVARTSMPHLTQVLFERPAGCDDEAAERLAHRVRRQVSRDCREAGVRHYAASCSFRTITYKAMAAAGHLARVYPDLQDERFTSALAIFHSRFSTNTAPTWERAQPFRMLCHNGEINTIQGNLNLLRAREGQMATGALSIDATDWIDPALLVPAVDATQSDSAILDTALDLLVRGGRDVRHAQAMLVPRVWEGVRDIDAGVRDFFRYHACLMEPWDGPAGLVWTDGRRVGASLDRNGLRPLRYHVCEDGLVAAASEVGAVPVSDGTHGQIRRERLGPGQVLCVDPDEGGLQEDTEIMAWLAARQPYGAWLADHLRSVPAGQPVGSAPADLHQRQLAYGVTREEVISILRPMATQGKEATSSMGDDTPITPLTLHRRPVFHYLRQRFAQVTNPPVDHYRENEVMSLRTLLGPRQPVLTERPEAARLLELPSFFVYPDGLRRLIMDPDVAFEVQAVDATFPVDDGPEGLEAALTRTADEAVARVLAGTEILVVSDVGVDSERARIPILLAVGATHQRLLREGLRTRVSIVAESDEARETHDFACLLGYGADAIVPPLVLQAITGLADEDRIGGDNPEASEAQDRYRRAVEDGVLKIMSKMGICTVDSYRSAQIFEALGLSQHVVDTCFTGTVTQLGGLTFEDLAADVLAQHAAAFPDELADPDDLPNLPSPGVIKWKQGGEFHDMSKPVVDALHATLGLGRRPVTEPFAWQPVEGDGPAEVARGILDRLVEEERTEHYARFVDEVHARPAVHPRDLVEFVDTEAISLEEVEPLHAIIARFSTGAMSHGALSAEAHQTLAAGMNLVGGRANSGEGGEAPWRHHTRGGRHDVDCRVKQVASGRFGVTPQYLAFAEELQIKMAQGSKPGEGGQIPGHKVTDEIAEQRHTAPGVTLISPPPHHDIYSIEDLAQLIFDLKQVNPDARVDVKLVAETGIGTVAAGVVKALADSVHISGCDGGTGASPLSSIQHAGMPWELGLAEVQQTLRDNRLRGRARLRVDGGLRVGRDVLVAALLGADEYAFGTSSLFATGCIMARACHRDTCPVGVATQRQELRDRFAGTPAQVAAYVVLVADEVRRGLARLGLRSLDEAIGRVDLLRPRALEGHAARLDPSPMLADPGVGERRFVARAPIQDPRSALGDRVFEDALETVFLGGIVEYRYRIHNADRTIGARLGGAVGLEFGTHEPNGLGRLRFEGVAGQSFGAFLTHGVELVLTGEANDYVAKGLGGGTMVIRPPGDDVGDPVLVGNTVLYGATSGELFVAGRAGERFAVRNSGAIAVVEGVGQHACEYMTGGTVVVLGPTGSNLGAGMSGGECFVHDPTSEVLARVNRQLVEAHRPVGGQLARLQELVERHTVLTGSRRGQKLLDDWAGATTEFWRIAPKTDMERLAAAEAKAAAD